MGNCCSTCARPRGKKRENSSSKQRNVSVRSSSSSFASESDLYKRDDSMESNVEDSSVRLQKSGAWWSQDGLDGAGFSRGGFVNTDVKTMLERNESRMDIQRRREKLDKEKQQKKHQNGHEGRKKESSIDGEYGVKVLESHPSDSGAIPRLKKKDSIRKPRYKDVTDNIDSIVEREIPDAKNLKTGAASSSSGTARNNGFMLKNIKRMRTVNIIEGEVECDDSVSVPLDIHSVSVPACIIKNLKPMDEEDMRVAKEIQDMLKQDHFKGHASEEIMSPISDQPQQPKEEETTIIEEEETEVSLTVALTASDADTVTPEVDEELTDDTDSISDEGIPIERSNGTRFHAVSSPVDNSLEKDQVLIGAASPQVDNYLDKDFDNCLTNDVLTKDPKETSSCKVSPRVDHDLVKEADNPSDDILEDSDGSCSEFQTLDNLFTAALQKRKSTKNEKKMDDNELANDIVYILSEDFSADESNETISTTSVLVPRPKQVDRVAVAEEGCASTPIQEDEDLEKDIECILLTVPDASDERIQCNTAIHPNKEQQLAKDTVNILQLDIQSDSNETMPPTPDPVSRSKRNYSTILAQKREEERVLVDVNTMVNDEIPTTAKLNWHGAFPRPKTRNPKRDLRRNMDEKYDSGPCRRPSAFRQQSDGIQKSSREIAAKRPVPLNSATGARPKTNFIRKPKKPEEIEMDKAFSKNSETPEFYSRALAGISSNHNSKVTGARLSNGGLASEFPGARNSSSSIAAQNFDSSSSIIIGDALRPMAARSSKANCTKSCHEEVKFSNSSLQDARVPRPPSTPKRKTKRPVIFVQSAPDTRLLSVASRNSEPVCDSGELKLIRDETYNMRNLHMPCNQKAAVPASAGKPSLAYDEITRHQRMTCNRKSAVPSVRRHRLACDQRGSKHVYDEKDLQLVREVTEGCDRKHQRMTGNNIKSSSCVQSFGPVYDAEDLKLMRETEMGTNEPNAGEASVEAHRLSDVAVTDSSSPSMASYKEAAGTATDKYSHACAQKWSPGIAYTSEELDLMDQIMDEYGQH